MSFLDRDRDACFFCLHEAIASGPLGAEMVVLKDQVKGLKGSVTWRS
jgi:hypothetical protein